MATARCYQGTEAQVDDIVTIIDKALAYPKIGTHIGGGRHVTMPPTWDSSGETPPGWTKRHTQTWVLNSTDAAVPISDADATELNRAAARARLTQAERDRLAAALATRANVELDGRTPKASAAMVAAEEIRR